MRARGDRSLTRLAAQDARALRVKLFSVADKRLLPQKEVFGQAARDKRCLRNGRVVYTEYI